MQVLTYESQQHQQSVPGTLAIVIAYILWHRQECFRPYCQAFAVAYKQAERQFEHRKHLVDPVYLETLREVLLL
jgi:hypothetical protein